MNLMAYVWIFFAFVFGIYAILLFADNDKIIPDTFKRNRDNEFYHPWRLLAGAGFLVVCSGMILFALSEYTDGPASTYWLLRGLGVLMWIIGFTIVFFFNRKAIRMFQPGFYKEYDEYKRIKEEKKAKKKALKEEKKAKKRALKEENHKSSNEKEGE